MILTAKRRMTLPEEPLAKMPFLSISALYSKFYPRNIGLILRESSFLQKTLKYNLKLSSEGEL
jgi:hypothetical protein